ncbi:MAG: DUF1993 domain-containing protein [Burkholderiales bacterium]|nr:DUF1993 domain-containing protein [Burkholderiales bacterium]
MAISMYQSSAPVFIRMLGNLSAILDRAQAHADAKKFDSAVYLPSRLAPDMLPFSKQVQIACDAAKGCMARLAGVEIPKHPDTETTLAELKARIATVIEYVKSFKPEQIDGTESKEIVLKLGPKQDRILNFNGVQFLQGFAMGNFYFHVTTAYALLRHQGVEIGKSDYLGTR